MSTFFTRSGGSPPRRSPVKRAFSGLVGRFQTEVPPRFIGRSFLQAIPIDTAALLDGCTDPRVTFTMSAAAIRAAKWRAKQGEEFKKHESERKATERAATAAESDRVEQLEDVLKKDPTNASNGPFVMRDAEHGTGLLVTGGYDGSKLSQIHAARNHSDGRVKPTGTIGTTFEKGKPLTSQYETNRVAEGNEEYEDTFISNAFRRLKSSKHVRIMKEFVYQHTRIAPGGIFVCDCGRQITPFREDVTELGFLHIVKTHEDTLFAALLKKLNGSGCPEDHDGMAARHGGGDIKVVCKRCKKVIYKPPRKKRSDKN